MKRIFKAMLRVACSCISLLLRPRRKSRSEDVAPRRIVFLAGAWLGDSFWALHAIRLAARRWPNADIRILLKSGSIPLFHGIVPDESLVVAPNLTSDRTRERISFAGMLRDIRTLRALRADVLFDLMGNRFSALFAALSGAGMTVGPRIADEWRNAYSVNVDFMPIQGAHLVLKPWTTVSALASDDDFGLNPLVPLPPNPALPPEDARRAAGLPQRDDKPLALLLPGAGWSAKRWPSERYGALAKRLSAAGFRTVVLCAKRDQGEFRSISAADPSAKLLSLPLADAISLLLCARVCAGGDTGLIHIAASFGIRTIGIYCPSNEKRSAPLGPDARVLTPPCPMHPTDDRQYCTDPPKKVCTEACWMDVSADDVFAACVERKDGAR